MGGIWRISPRNPARAASTSARPAAAGRRASTVPVLSWVSVTTPSLSPATYSLRDSAANSTARVARPTKTGSTPVAMGSRVPAWPTRRSRRMPRTLATTSWEVQSWGLSMTIIPFAIGICSLLASLQGVGVSRGHSDKIPFSITRLSAQRTEGSYR